MSAASLISSLSGLALSDVATPARVPGAGTAATAEEFAGLVDAAQVDVQAAEPGSSEPDGAAGEASSEAAAAAVAVAVAAFSPPLTTPAIVLNEAVPATDEGPAPEPAAGESHNWTLSTELEVTTSPIPKDTGAGPSVLPQAPADNSKAGVPPLPEAPEVLPGIDAISPSLVATEGDTAVTAPSPAVLAAVAAQVTPRQLVPTTPPERTTPRPAEKATAKPRVDAGEGPEVLYGPGGAGGAGTDGVRPRPGLEARLDGIAGRQTQGQVQIQVQVQVAAAAPAPTEDAMKPVDLPDFSTGQAQALPAADTAPVVAHEVLSGISHSAIQATAQIAAQIVRKLEGRSTRFEMALTPDDLGQVDVSISIDADGQLAARLAFDNPLAALDLRGRADELRRQLEEAGFRLAEDALQFAERDPSSRRDGTFDQRSRQAFARSGRLAEDADVEISAPIAGRWISLSLTPDRVDVKV